MRLANWMILPVLALSFSSCGQNKTDGNQETPVRRVIMLENTSQRRPYSPAIEVDNTLYVSGQVAIDPETGNIVEGGIEAQTRQTLENLKNIIEKAGYSMGNVVRCTVLLAGIEFYSDVNQIYMEYFPVDPPARMAFAVKDLPLGALIEIDAIAIK